MLSNEELDAEELGFRHGSLWFDIECCPYKMDDPLYEFYDKGWELGYNLRDE